MNKFLENKNEILLVVYLFNFSLLKFILVKNPSLSTIILTISAGLVIGIWLFFEIIYKRKFTISYKHLLFIITIYSLLLFQMVMRNNNKISDIIYRFTIYGAIPVVLSSKISNYKYLLWIYALFSIINGIVYFFDPLNSYVVSGGYMNFGFTQMLPAFSGSIIIFNVFKKKYGMILATIFFIQMFLHANKGASVCALCIWITSFIFFNKEDRIIKKRLFIVASIIIVALLNLENIAMLLIKIIKSLNMETYSLTTFLNILQYEGNKVYHVRTDIWEKAIQLFMQNPLLGFGIGYFESEYNYYIHNFFLDIIVSNGIIGITIILLLLIISIRKMLKSKDEYKKYFYIIVFLMTFIPMMFSLSYWNVSTFWIYWGILLKKDNKSGEKYNE